MNALITGVNGFVGSHLASLLLHKDRTVYGIDFTAESSLKGIHYIQHDILDVAGIAQLCTEVGAREIYHLAAVSYPPQANASPYHAFETNIMGTMSLLDGIRQAGTDARVLLVGSSKEYSDFETIDPIPESIHPNPTSFYGISKYVGEVLGGQYVRQYNMDIRFSRSFNHTGPGQSPQFVCSEWAKHIASIELGLCEARLNIGNINTAIDFLDVRDVVLAYHLILENGSAGSVYNICSGKTVKLEFVLEYLIKKSSRTIQTVQSPEKKKLSKSTTSLRGDNRKIRQETGWQALIPIEKTLDDLYEYWHKRLSNEQKQ